MFWLAQPVAVTCVIIGVLVPALRQASQTEAPKPTPVATTLCAILTEPSRFDQLMVTVRGHLIRGREVYLLEDQTCASRLKTDDHLWPPAISLTPPNDSAHLPSGFVLDRDSFDRLDEAIRSAGSIYPKPRVIVTVTGKIDARQRYSGRKGNSMWIGNGFGHMNQYAAQLVYMSASDWVIAPR